MDGAESPATGERDGRPAARPAGYTYGTAAVEPAMLTLGELEGVKRSAGFGPDEEAWLRRAGELLVDRADELVGAWRGVIGAEPHLAAFFAGPDGRPDEAYKAAVRARFAQWVRDVCRRPYDQDWLDYQREIGRRHTRAKKNLTDGAQTPPELPLRYLIAFGAVVIVTTKPYLGSGKHPPDEVERMHEAWTKAVLLHVALWSEAYLEPG